ncbi:addiction module protein [Crateriforma conspicua]|uniref:addiction module protein n=1 Tax=Crateriforma spongiae TaxID=2724528 RepID=UPI0018CF86F7
MVLCPTVILIGCGYTGDKRRLGINVAITRASAWIFTKTMNRIDIAREAIALPLAERLEVVGKIWDSVVDEGLPSLSDAQRSLIDERIEMAGSNPDQRTLAADVYKELRRDGRTALPSSSTKQNVI